MTTDEFLVRYDKKGVDFDHSFGFQCMDLVEFYNRDVVGAPRIGGNAVDVWTNYPKLYYQQIKNTSNNFPQKGDIVVWGKAIGQFGHVAISVGGDANHFTSMDQNWPAGSICHYQIHDYKGVLGWLRPKPIVSNPQPTVSYTVTPEQSDDEKRALKILNEKFALLKTPDGQPFGTKEGFINALVQDAYTAWLREPQLIAQLKTSPTVSTISTAELLGELSRRILGR